MEKAYVNLNLIQDLRELVIEWRGMYETDANPDSFADELEIVLNKYPIDWGDAK